MLRSDPNDRVRRIWILSNFFARGRRLNDTRTDLPGVFMFRSDWLRIAFAMVLVALAAPACSLPAPRGIVGGGDGGVPTGQCPAVATTDAGLDSGTGVIVSADPT